MHRPVRLSDTSIPKVNTGDLRGGAGHRPHRSQPPRRLIDHTPPPSSADRCSSNCRRQRFSCSKRCSPSCDSCRHCGGRTPSSTAYIYKVCLRCEWSYELLLDPDAWRSDCRSRRYTDASLCSYTWHSRGCGYIKNPAWLKKYSISLPECVIMWRFSWFVEMNFLSHEWHSNISCTWNKHEIYKRSRKHESWGPWCALLFVRLMSIVLKSVSLTTRQPTSLQLQ